MTLETLETTVLETARAAPGYSRVRDRIRAEIVDGQLPSGSRLKVAELARRYDSSTIPVREALQQLQGEGLVVFVPNCGASVRAVDERFVANIHEIRAVMEPLLLQGFVRRHTAGELAQLEAVQREYDAGEAAGDLNLVRDLNRRFHGICYDGHPNEEALAIAYRHNDVIRALSNRFPLSRMRARTVCREHWAIIEAIRRQDEAEAMRLMAEHVRNAGQHLIDAMRVAGRGPV